MILKPLILNWMPLVICVTCMLQISNHEHLECLGLVERNDCNKPFSGHNLYIHTEVVVVTKEVLGRVPEIGFK